MLERKDQIVALLEAKSDVQSKLDTIFEEEFSKFLSSFQTLSLIDAVKAEQALTKVVPDHLDAMAKEMSHSGTIEREAVPNNGIVGHQTWDEALPDEHAVVSDASKDVA